MKRLIFLILLMLCSILFARIGESLEEVKKRYGSIQKIIEDKYVFNFKHYFITVLIYNEMSIMETFTKTKNNTLKEALIGEEITETEIDVLLKANIGEKYIKLDEDTYSGGNGRYFATYESRKHALVVGYVPLFEEYMMKEKNKVKKSMEGF